MENPAEGPSTHSSSRVGSSLSLIRESELDLKDVWNFAVRNKLLILGVAAFGMLVGQVVTWRTTPIYRSSASVQIEDDDPINQMGSVLGPELGSTSLRAETEMGVLLSRTLAEEVVDSLNLMVQLVSPRGIPRDAVLSRVHAEAWATSELYELTRIAPDRFTVHGSRTATVDTISVGDDVVVNGATFALTPRAADYEQLEISVATFQRAVGRVRGQTRVTRPDRTALILRVDYESTDTMLVDDVPNLLVSSYIRRRLQSQQMAASNTVTFLRGQLDSLSLELTHAEDDLQAYRQGEQVVNLQAEGSAQVTQLARLQADRNALDSERGALQQLLDGINREASQRPTRRGEPSPYRRLIAFPTLLQNGAASQLLQNMTTLGDQRSELLRRRTLEDPDVESLTSRIEQLEDQLRTIAVTYLQGLSNQVASYDQTLRRFGGELARIPAKELAVARLERRSTILRDIFTLLQTRLKEAEIAQAAKDPDVSVIDQAILETGPIGPRRNLNLLFGALIGMILGVSIAAGRDFMDRTVHTREDVDEASGGIPLVGIIPQMSPNGAMNGKVAAKNGRRSAAEAATPRESRLVALYHPRDPVTEAYRALRTNIRFARFGESPKVLVLTSALPRDGKSTTASNLAIVLAQQGTRTLLIDADLRRGLIGGLFHVPQKPGLTNILIGEVAVRDAIRKVEVGSDLFLDVLPSGAFPPNPAELIGSDRMVQLLKKLSEHYDAIIVDTAPLNLVTDAAVLGACAGGVLLVARAAATDRGALRFAADQLRSVGAPILGAILNDVNAVRDGRYGSSYGSYYADYGSYYGETGKKRTPAQV